MRFLVGFRKFSYGLIFILISLILLLSGYISGSDWILYNKDVALAFMATNIGEHLIKITKDYINDKLIAKLK